MKRVILTVCLTFFSLNQARADQKTLRIELENLVETGTQLNFHYSDGTTPLILAIKANLSDTVDRLIRGGADPNFNDRTGRSPLMHCFNNRDSIGIFNRLIINGAILNEKDVDRIGNIVTYDLGDDRVKNKLFALIEHDLINANLRTQRDKKTLLMAKRLSPNLIKDLIEMGIDVNAQDSNGNTALFYQIENNIWADPEYTLEIVQLLTNSGANLNHQNNNKHTAFDFVLDRGSARGDTYSGDTTTIKIIRHLLTNGFDVNVQDAKGRTPLMNVMDDENLWPDFKLEIVQLLITAGANLNLQANNKKTAFDYLLTNRRHRFASSRQRRNSSIKIIEYMLTNGFDVNVQDAKGRTPLMNLILNEELGLESYELRNLVPLFKAAGADLSIEDEFGYTASDIAWEKRRLRLFFQL